MANWSVAQHDTIPQVDLWLNPLETHVYLSAFLSCDNEAFSPPYQPIRTRIEAILAVVESRKRRGQAPRGDVEDQRIRTWKSMFEDFGFLTVTPDNRITLTRLGRKIHTAYETLNQRIEGANDELAKVAIEVLNRHLLSNPIDS